MRNYLHMVMHCVFLHMFVDPTLNRPYWDLACDIAVENIITELGLRAVTTAREKQQAQYISGEIGVDLKIPAINPDQKNIVREYKEYHSLFVNGTLLLSK